ncbi:MAG: ABC transporter substrate-binding protein [Gemmatimonadota bacterium]
MARLVVLALGVALLACGEDAPRGSAGPHAVTVVDDAGQTVRLGAPAERMISLVPSVTESVIALGAAGRLVARTRYDTAPEVAGLPSVGGGLDPSLEALVALDPDLVIAWDGAPAATLGARLAASGIPLYRAAIEDTAAVFRTLDRLGELLGLPGPAADATRGLRDSLTAIAAESVGMPRPSVFYLLAGRPPRTAGTRTFIGELIEVAGGRPAFPELEQLWPAVALEAVVARNPDVILVPGGGEEAARLARARGWRDMPAVREGRVIEVPGDLFSRPGPGIADAARTLREALRTLPARP